MPDKINTRREGFAVYQSRESTVVYAYGADCVTSDCKKQSMINAGPQAVSSGLFF